MQDGARASSLPPDPISGGIFFVFFSYAIEQAPQATLTQKCSTQGETDSTKEFPFFHTTAQYLQIVSARPHSARKHMIAEITPIFAHYEALRNEVDSLFAKVHAQYADCVTCAKGCDDCCHALFDLSLVEAMYINDAFQKSFDYGPERSEILTRAADIDRKLTKLKRDLYRKEKNGTSKEEIIAEAAILRMPCPLLSTEKTCLLYEHRPITCRLYGIPTVIQGHGHVCGFSRFQQGIQYPTVHLDKIQGRLEAMSGEIAKAINSRFTELDQVYVPLSMALITHYDEQYLGIGQSREE